MQKTQDYIQKKPGNYIEKVRQIGEILGLLEETHRSKGWILQEMRRHNLKVTIKPTMNSYEILDSCPSEFIEKLLHILKGVDIENQEFETITKTYHWFFTDIVAGSNPSIPTKAQVRKIITLNELISRTDAFRTRDLASTIILPTGDGMAIGFADSPEKPVQLAIALHKALAGYNQQKRGKEKLLIRIGLESGPVYFVKDLEGKYNVWGRGIIMTRRVMDLTGDMQIFASSMIAEALAMASPDYKKMLHPVQNYETKYGERIRLYNMYGEGFGNKTVPLKAKIAYAQLQRKVKAASNFSFTEIEVLLDIIDASTMQTHHTWTWNILNISKEPKSQIFYYLDGHFPEKFSDMKLSVTNELGEKLEIANISVDRPHHKEFYVGLKKSILPRQRTRLKLQYDCQEPDRVFSYRFPSGAKKFSYICTVPKEVDLRNRILKVDIGTGFKIHATPPARIKRIDDRTIITWGKSNIAPQDAYQFEW